MKLRPVLTHAIALGIGLGIAWYAPNYRQQRDAKEIRLGYAVPFTVDGIKYTFSLRKRPYSYPSWCTPIWIVEGWNPEEAERLLEITEDEILGNDGAMSGRVRFRE